MVLVSLVVSTICLGGGKDLDAFKFVGSLILFFWGLPLLALVTVLHFVERWLGTYARLLIAAIGLIPLGLCIAFGFRGDRHFMGQMVMAGLAWSFAWILTSLLFPKPAYFSLSQRTAFVYRSA
jgi:hypothetical protein